MPPPPFPICIPDLTEDVGRRSCAHKLKQGVDVFWLGPRHPSKLPQGQEAPCGLPRALGFFRYLQKEENSGWDDECWKEKFEGYHLSPRLTLVAAVSLIHPGEWQEGRTRRHSGCRQGLLSGRLLGPETSHHVTLGWRGPPCSHALRIGGSSALRLAC